MLDELRCDWCGRLGRSIIFGWQRNVPRQQRLVVVGGLSERQGHEQGLQIAVRVDAVGLAGLQQRVQICARVGAGHGIREQPVASSDDKWADRILARVVVKGRQLQFIRLMTVVGSR